MSYFIPATLAVTAFAALSVVSQAPKNEKLRTANFHAQALVENASQWAISNRENGLKCLSLKGADGQFTIGKNCAEVTEDLRTAAKWRADEDGISIVDVNDIVMATFEPSKDRTQLVSGFLTLSPAD